VDMVALYDLLQYNAFLYVRLDLAEAQQALSHVGQ
jgi:hypothetical protein